MDKKTKPAIVFAYPGTGAEDLMRLLTMELTGDIPKEDYYSHNPLHYAFMSTDVQFIPHDKKMRDDIKSQGIMHFLVVPAPHLKDKYKDKIDKLYNNPELTNSLMLNWDNDIQDMVDDSKDVKPNIYRIILSDEHTNIIDTYLGEYILHG